MFLLARLLVCAWFYNFTVNDDHIIFRHRTLVVHRSSLGVIFTTRVCMAGLPLGMSRSIGLGSLDSKTLILRQKSGKTGTLLPGVPISHHYGQPRDNCSTSQENPLPYAFAHPHGGDDTDNTQKHFEGIALRPGINAL